jgi:hypothetical protein
VVAQSSSLRRHSQQRRSSGTGCARMRTARLPQPDHAASRWANSAAHRIQSTCSTTAPLPHLGGFRSAKRCARTTVFVVIATTHLYPPAGLSP